MKDLESLNLVDADPHASLRNAIEGFLVDDAVGIRRPDLLDVDLLGRGWRL